MAIDLVLLEVLRNRLEAICDEMQLILRRTAYSNTIKEANDCTCSIYNTKGELIALSTLAPAVMGVMNQVIASVLNKFHQNEMKEGDIYITNNPYQGAPHLPDISMVSPVFFEGELMALTYSFAHHADVGGMAPGSKPMNATEILQEGIIIPPIKLYSEGRVNETLFEMMDYNTRLSQIVKSDLEAQVVGGKIGQKRLQALVQRYGKKIFHDYTEELLARTETAMKRRIEEFPKGTYRAVGYVDTDGVDNNSIKVEVSVTIKGSEMIVDFAGTSPQTKGPANCTKGSTISAAYSVLRGIIDPYMATNGGCLRPIKILAPEGSVVNPKWPAPVNARIPTVSVITYCLMRALSQVVPERVTADATCCSTIFFSGVNHITKKPFAFLDFVAPGDGARPTKDGVSVRCCIMENILNQPTEVIELNYPSIMVEKFGFRDDSNGLGKYTGGLGAVKIYKVVNDEVRIVHQANCQKIAPQGLFGGGPGLTEEAYILRKDGNKEILSSKATSFLYQGDKLVVMTPGGGGYGYSKKKELA